MNNRNIINKILYLAISCGITTGLDFLFSCLKGEKLIEPSFYFELFLGILFWFLSLKNGRLDNWRTKK